MAALAIFDVDGVVLRGQSLLGLAKFLLIRGRLSIRQLIFVITFFLRYATGSSKNLGRQRQSTFLLFAGYDANQLNRDIDEYCAKDLQSRLDPRIIELIVRHKKQGDTVWLASSSLESIVQRVALLVGADAFFSSKLESRNGKITGNLERDTWGHQKAVAIKDALRGSGENFAKITVYTDHLSDLPMIELATEVVAVNPRPDFEAHARAYGWAILRT